MDNLGIFSELIVIPVMGICFAIGFFIKKRTKIPSDYIPAVMAVCGLILNIINARQMGEAITLSTISAGLITGLATSGFYDLLKVRLRLNKKKSKNNSNEENVDAYEDEDETYYDEEYDDDEMYGYYEEGVDDEEE